MYTEVPVKRFNRLVFPRLTQLVPTFKLTIIPQSAIAMIPKTWVFLFGFLFLDNLVFVLSSCNKENTLYLIRSTASPLVLDAGDGKLVVQHLQGHSLQLWTFKRASRPGLFYIVNSDSGKVLDVDRADGNRVILASENNSLEQQWTLNSNGRITNAAFGKVLDIAGAQFVPGNLVKVWDDNGTPAQQFIIKEKLTCCSSPCKFSISVEM